MSVIQSPLAALLEQTENVDPIEDEFWDEESSDESEFGEIVSDWLDENDPDSEEARRKSGGKSVHIPESTYIKEHIDEFVALCEVEDLDFASKDVAEMEDIMKTMSVSQYRPEEYIFKEGETSSDLYIVIGDQRSTHRAFVEVIRDNKVVTRLYRGMYFGQMQFLTRERQPRARNASIRAPSLLSIGNAAFGLRLSSDADNNNRGIKVARIPPERFEKWNFFRNMLIVKAVPFLHKLPLESRRNLLSLTDIQHYKDGERIVTQGEPGDAFYIVLDGTVKVMEGTNELTELATLRGGHCFGEMSLVTNEPRYVAE